MFDKGDKAPNTFSTANNNITPRTTRIPTCIHRAFFHPGASSGISFRASPRSSPSHALHERQYNCPSITGSPQCGQGKVFASLIVIFLNVFSYICLQRYKNSRYSAKNIGKYLEYVLFLLAQPVECRQEFESRYLFLASWPIRYILSAIFMYLSFWLSDISPKLWVSANLELKSCALSTIV